MMMDMPTGAGFLYQKMPMGGFKWSSMLRKTKFSYESIEWLSFMEMKSESQINIRHAMNGGELKFHHKGLNFLPDGYRVIHGVSHFYFYDGCYFHECKHNCKVSDKSTHLKPNDDLRDKLVSEIGIVHKISSCEWDGLKSNITLKSKLSKYFNCKRRITETELFEAIINYEIFGLVQCDIKSPQSVVDRFMKLNFPPIFIHREVHAESVGDYMREEIIKSKRKFPLNKQLTLGFHAKQHLITTEQFIFYHKQGMIMDNFALVIEYQRDKPLKKFVEVVTEHRKQATLDKDESKQQLYKLVANSSYGRMGMNLTKQRDVKYVRTDEADKKKHFNAFNIHRRLVNGEYPSGYTEIVSNKKKIVDTIPVHMSFFVLANAKLHFLKFIELMLDYWDTTQVKLTYMDTG